MIYVSILIFTLPSLLLENVGVGAQEAVGGEAELPLDPGPASFQSPVNPTVLKLPEAANLNPRPVSDLDELENLLPSMLAQPLEVRRKFGNPNPVSSAIAKAARAQEWSRMFGEGNKI